MFEDAEPALVESQDGKDLINPNSLKILTNCQVEPELENAIPGINYQFERLGYFCVDTGEDSQENRVFNRTISLRDSWAKIQNR